MIRSSRNTVRVWGRQFRGWGSCLEGWTEALSLPDHIMLWCVSFFFSCRCWGKGYSPGGTGSSSDAAAFWGIFWDRVCLSHPWWGTPAWYSGAWGLCSWPECQQLCHGWNLQSSCKLVFHIGRFLWEWWFGCGNGRELIRQVSWSLDWVSRALRSDMTSVFEKKSGALENELKVWGP